MTLKLRTGIQFKKWIDSQSISKTKAADMLGVSRQQVYSYFTSENLNHKTAEHILDVFKVKESEIWRNDNWINTNDVNNGFANNDHVPYYRKGINHFIKLNNGSLLMVTPLVEEYAQAGFLSGYNDLEFLEELPNHSFVLDRNHKGKYYSFRVSGNGMDNGTSESIMSRSIVTARDIEKGLWNSRFQIIKFKDYVIVHKEGILIKRIIDQNPEKGTITCGSINIEKEKYPDLELNLDECKMLLQIVNVCTSR
ncbi:hypothetical protein [Algoriphagus sp.]|uniref:S24 family peptidase n=1 Tax=Algoriphagus sp. TaxID=1872435 RepID=UPI00327381C9